MEANAVQKTHPLIIVAAASVTALSLAGVGAIFGVIPTGGTKPATDAQQLVQTAPPVAAPVVPAAIAATPPVAKAEAASTISLPAGSSVRIDTPSDKPRRVVAAKPAPVKEIVYVDRPTPASSNHVRVANNDDSGIYVERARNDAGERERSSVVAPTCRDCGTIAAIREIPREGEANGVGAVAGGLLGGVVGRQVGGGKGRDAMTVLGALGGAYAGHQVEKNQRSSRDYQITVRYDDGTTQTITQSTAPAWRQGERVRIANGQIVSL